jgi:dual specificity tyrosine-phosphorylation-regulated kinase 2/3/4
MIKIKPSHLQTPRTINIRANSSKRCSTRSPKQLNNLTFKFHTKRSNERSPRNGPQTPKTPAIPSTRIHLTPRSPTKLRVSTPSSQLHFLQKLTFTKENPKEETKQYSIGKFLKEYKTELTELELSEVFNYKVIYYWGMIEEKEARVKAHKYGDDEKGNLMLFKRDHIGYRYEIVNLLGQGSFGQVCECIDHKDNQRVAIKIIKNAKQFVKPATNEIKILKLIKEKDPDQQSNILHIKDTFTFRSHICIVTELLGKNLYEVHKDKGFCSFPASVIKKFAVQILTALNFLSNNHIIHCDLKPENILISKTDKNSIKLADFGSSCLETEKIFSYIQSRFYRAPEVILGFNYGCGIDMWSFGCILAELANGKPLFPAGCERELLQMIMQVKGLVPNELLAISSKKKKFFEAGEIVPDRNCKVLTPMSLRMEEIVDGESGFVDFVQRCLEWNPEKRMSPAEALEHAWLKKSDRIILENSKFLKILNKRIYNHLK